MYRLHPTLFAKQRKAGGQTAYTIYPTERELIRSPT